MNDNQTSHWTKFADSANWSSLHSLDLDRFADFVVESYPDHAPDFDALLADSVTDEEDMRADVATHLGTLYDFGSKVLDADRKR